MVEMRCEGSKVRARKEVILLDPRLTQTEGFVTMIHEEKNTIYERMGGADTVRKLVYSFYNRVLDDPVLAPFFEHAPMDKLRNMQEEFFTAATGGPIVYTGKPLSEVHGKFKIGLKEFQRFAEHLLDTLKEVGVGDDDANEIIGQVNLMVGDITGETGRTE